MCTYMTFSPTGDECGIGSTVRPQQGYVMNLRHIVVRARRPGAAVLLNQELFAGSQSVMVDPNPSPWLSARSVPPWASAI